MIGWLKNNKWKFIRRLVQSSVLFVLVSPVLGLHIFKGSLISGEFFGISLTDPLAAIDFMLASKSVYVPLLLGALLILVFYFVVGGRVFCGWVCPVFLLTEAAEKLHKRLTVFNHKPSSNQKYWVLGIVLFLSFVTSKPVFEMVSPIGILSQNISQGLDYQGAVFGRELALESGKAYGNVKADILADRVEKWRFVFNRSLWIILTIFLIDVFVTRGWWCKYTCPVGAFYSLVGRRSPTKIKIDHTACDNCGLCFQVCFVQEVLVAPVQGNTDWVVDGVCTNCLNCVDVCPEKALKLGIKLK